MANWRDKAKPMSVEANNDWRSRAKPVVEPAHAGNIEQEMPDFISAKDRLVAKNLAQSPQKQMEYLKLQHPDKEFQLVGEQVVARSPGDKGWKALDPDTGFFSKDFINDVGDIGYDTIMGVPQSAAVALAAAGGGLATGGWGALPAGMAASGATSAANEALRQKLGQVLGIPQEVDGGDVVRSGAIGTFMPAVSGSGNLAKTALAKNASKETLNMLQSQGRGLLGRMLDRGGRMASSVPNVAIDAYNEYGDEAMKAVKDGGILQYLEPVGDQMLSAAKGNERRIGGKLESLYKQAGNVDITSAKDVYKSAISEFDQIKATRALTGAEEAQLSNLNKQYRHLFGFAPDKSPPPDLTPYVDHWKGVIRPKAPPPKPTELPDVMPATDLFRIRKQVKHLTSFENQDPNYADFIASKEANALHRQSGKILKAAAGPEAGQLNDEYMKALDVEALVRKYAKDPKTLFQALSNVDAGARIDLKETLMPNLAEIGVDLQKPQKVATAYKWFANPSELPISSGGTTSTTRSNITAQAFGDAGEVIGEQVGGYPAKKALGFLGRLGGAFAASPANTKRVLDARAKQVLPAYISPNVATPTLIDLLNQRYRDDNR